MISPAAPPLAVLALLVLAPPALADPARIDDARFRHSGETWTIAVTLRHADTGWDDYADGWRVETPEGTILGTRVLAHPHVEEQPFTRSLSGVTIPAGVTHVVIRSRTSVTGWADSGRTFPLP